MPGELNWLADKAIALGVNLVLDQLGLQPDEHDGRVLVPEVAEVSGVKWLCDQDGSVITLIGRPTSGKSYLARRLAEVISRPTYAVSPHEVPPRWIKRLDFADILTSPPPGSTLILDDILTYMSAKMWRQQFIQEVEKMLPTARHDRKLTLILCTQVTSLMDKYGLRADVICAKPPDLAYADTERPGIKRMYDRIAPVWEGRTEHWIHRHCYMITHDWEGVVRINKARGIVEKPQGQQE